MTIVLKRMTTRGNNSNVIWEQLNQLNKKHRKIRKTINHLLFQVQTYLNFQ